MLGFAVLLNLMSWDSSELLKTKEASIAKRGQGKSGKGKGHGRKNKEEDDQEEGVSVTTAMVGYGLRKATFKARTGKQVKLVGREKLKKGQKRATEEDIQRETERLAKEANEGGVDSRNKRQGDENGEAANPKKKTVTEVSEENVNLAKDVELLDKSIDVASHSETDSDD